MFICRAKTKNDLIDVIYKSFFLSLGTFDNVGCKQDDSRLFLMSFSQITLARSFQGHFAFGI